MRVRGDVSDGSGPSAPVRVLRIEGIELHYTDEGSGATVILLHGGMGDLSSWTHHVRALSPHYRVVSYSRRRSHPNRNGNAPCQRFADCLNEDIADLLALQARLHAGRAHLLGTSYGALLALAVALRAPDKVASLVLAEPPLHRWARTSAGGEQLFGAFMHDVWQAAAQAFRRGMQRRAMQLLADGMWGRPMFQTWPEERITALMRNAPAMKALTQSRDPFPDVDRSAVASLAMPTLLVQGDHTSALHRQVMAELGDVMRDAVRATISLAGHGSPNENPAGFEDAVVHFFDALRRADGETR